MDGGLISGAYKMCSWISKLAYVNILWVLFTVLGLGIFGFGPSSAALFSIQRKWILGRTEIPIFKSFWDYYRTHFIKANLLGLSFVVGGMLLYLNYQFIIVMEGPFQSIYIMLTWLFVILFILTFAYLFPLYVHMEFKSIKEYIKNAFFLAVTQIASSLTILIGCFAAYFLINLFPGLLPFYSVSLLGLLCTFNAHRAFNRLSVEVSGTEK
ncbi:YesL family protein [Niallia sp. JL1B1071]|uniref:YesL family protein n=1 Tax=Niallia tiangongensis TaxID=3237105 RepID=UPI0037DC0BD9